MNLSRPNTETNMQTKLLHVARVLGSLKLAVVLLATLAAVIAAATILEAKYSRTHAQWFVYNATWFVILLGILGVNIFCAAAIRWPWKRHQIGFVIRTSNRGTKKSRGHSHSTVIPRRS